jgi:hypothetical protein
MFNTLDIKDSCFLAGTKLPSRNAWLQSSLPRWSSVPRNANQMRSHTPCSCHSWSRRWQVERLPYFGGKSFQRAPERSIQRMPLRVRRSSARGLPRPLCAGSNGSISAHWSSRSSSPMAQPSPLRRWAQSTFYLRNRRCTSLSGFRSFGTGSFFRTTGTLPSQSTLGTDPNTEPPATFLISAQIILTALVIIGVYNLLQNMGELPL